MHPPEPTTSPTPPDTIIGEGHVVEGTVKGDEDIEVRGQVRGRIEIAGILTVSPQGRVKADVSAREIHVRGRLECTAVTADLVWIAAGAVVVGKIRAPRLILADGGRLRGQVDTASEREELIDAVLSEVGSWSLQLFGEPHWSGHTGGA